MNEPNTFISYVHACMAGRLRVRFELSLKRARGGRGGDYTKNEQKIYRKQPAPGRLCRRR